jgi:hypothetical protein
LANRILGQLSEEHIDGRNDMINKCYKQITDTAVNCKSGLKLDEGIYAVGLHRERVLSPVEIIALEKVCHCSLLSVKVHDYTRFIINGCLYHTYDYSINFRNTDCYVTLLDRRGIFRIQSLVCAYLDDDSQVSKCFLILTVLFAMPVAHYDNDLLNTNIMSHATNTRVTERHVICHPSNVGRKCIILSSKSGHNYAFVLPVFELD